ncbi:MAG: methyl-accepting chemotaxis protein [Deltaproteobacteria bacterium]|nr:methyl-accepting chemotaxis protein [Deltaproteobacteria bacterium]MBW2111648.1 methyl-accepting chemotaxis protein [Deltaproteobacteria bacterium]MBW2352220.1 methyl-accepting chemotaxis protein [Deltaproteobacteria bacterium]
MRMPFQDRSLFFKLLSANILIILLIAISWFAVSSHYLRKSQRADDILEEANSILLQELQLRRAEKDFFLRGLTSKDFYETGQSKYLTKYRRAFSLLQDRLRTLSTLLEGENKQAADDLKNAADRYEELFLKLVEAYRTRGHYNWGVMGDLRKAIHKAEKEVDKTGDPHVRILLLQLRRAEKDYLLRGEKKYFQKVKGYLGQLREDIRKLNTTSGTAILESLASYEKAFTRYRAIQREIGLDEEAGLRAGLRSAIHKMEPAARQVVKNATVDRQVAQQDIIKMNLLTLIMVLVLGCAIFYFFARGTARPLLIAAESARKMAAGDLSVDIPLYERKDEVGVLMRAFHDMLNTLRDQTRQMIEGSNTIATSISELSTTVGQLASTSAETSTSVITITTTVEEVKQTAEVSSEKAGLVAQKSEQTYEVSESGKDAADKTREGMSVIKEEMAYIADGIMELSEHMQSIGEIIDSVNDIADQSNLLAVNASIEAAKAGEYGKGFAVVAQEVKSLADQSKEATNRVRAILNDIQKGTSNAVMATERGNKAVNKGVDLVTRLGETVELLAENIAESAQSAIQISASSEQQLVGMNQLAQAMQSIKEASAQNVDGARQLEGAIKDLEGLGQRLKEMTSRFKV